jgi:2-polyprenyl-6-methoxyphenol hydroxylase-like FAD-dependent oxidoreductase
MTEPDTRSGAPVQSALIIGAGPAGLSAAVSLRRAGVGTVHVIEAQDRQGVTGAELSVSSPMLRALDGIGLGRRVAAAGIAIAEAQMCAPDGTVHASIAFPGVAGPDLPGTVGLGRAMLHTILWEAAEAAGAMLWLGRRVTELDNRPDHVTVTFSDGETSRYDLVVGADGVRSQTRVTGFPDAPVPEYTGQIAWRARVPRRTPPMLAVFNAPDRKAGLITVTNTDSYLFLLVNAPHPGRPDQQEFPKLLREGLAEFGGPIADVREDITDASLIHYSPLTSVLVPGPWYRKRVLLIGDAAHATTPHLAYGAGLAVEDGAILGEELTGAPDVGTALDSFAERRFERCRMVVDNGLQIQRWEVEGSLDADPAGLTMRTQMAISLPA